MTTGSNEWKGVALSHGRYVVSDKLGEGGMGYVYRARDRNLDTDVVIKVPRQSMMEDPEFAGRFAREIRSLVRLQHPAGEALTPPQPELLRARLELGSGRPGAPRRHALQQGAVRVGLPDCAQLPAELDPDRLEHRRVDLDRRLRFREDAGDLVLDALEVGIRTGAVSVPALGHDAR